MSIMKKPELLSPAGDYESFLCAMNAGADACYLAGNEFGARAYAKNFSKEELLRALDYAILKDKKIYLTVNTLAKDCELEHLCEFLEPFYQNGLHGVIVQDLGVLRMIRENFPGLALHGSTQMCVTSPYGANFLKEIGVSRVVPARELSMEEVKEIVNTGIETECFIHGSMCYCYSGQCLYSSMIGGRSGNRGRCAQPCRLPYQFDKKQAHYLSLKDMCTLEFLPELMKVGIDSYKIEGRMKSPAYSGAVTEIYRRYIDTIIEHPSKKIVFKEEDKKILSSLYIRSEIQNGYYKLQHGADMITLDFPGYAKTDEQLSKDIIDKYTKQSFKIPISGQLYLNIGEPAVFLVTDPVCFNVSGAICQEAKNSPLNLEDVKKRISKTGDSFFEFTNLDIFMEGNVFLPNSALNELKRNVISELLNELTGKQKRFINEQSEKKNEQKKTDDEKKEDVVSDNKNSISLPEKIIFIKTKEQFDTALNLKYSLTIPYHFLEKEENLLKIQDRIEPIYLEFPEIVRKNDLRLIRCIQMAEEIPCIRGIYVNQIDSLEICRDAGWKKELRGNIHLYVWNTFAQKELSGHISSYTISPELKKEEINAATASLAEMMLYGRIPLMNTANCILYTTHKCQKLNRNESGDFIRLKDRKSALIPVLCHCDETICFNTLYNSVPLSLHKHFNEIAQSGFRALQIRFTDESLERMKRILYLYEGLFDGLRNMEPDFEFTNGNYIRGVL